MLSQTDILFKREYWTIIYIPKPSIPTKLAEIWHNTARFQQIGRIPTVLARFRPISPEIVLGKFWWSHRNSVIVLDVIEFRRTNTIFLPVLSESDGGHRCWNLTIGYQNPHFDQTSRNLAQYSQISTKIVGILRQCRTSSNSNESVPNSGISQILTCFAGIRWRSPTPKYGDWIPNFEDFRR